MPRNDDDFERNSDAERKATGRAQKRDLRIPRIKEPNRRIDCLADIYQFLPTYFPGIFTQPFTSDRREMLDAILHAARYGGDQAIAGPRGDGKTRSALFGTLALMLAGYVSFPMIISKSGPRANRELKNFKDAIEGSITFAEDFPEVAWPILKLGRWSSRARQQTAYGKLTNMEWGEECIIFPTINTATLHANDWDLFNSAARGQIFASLGIEGPIRGYSVRNERPDLAILDDIDSRESAQSETQTETRVRIIEEDVGGLGGPDRSVARVMLCTLLNNTCVAATYTDRTEKPSWRPQRHRLLDKEPENKKLVADYIRLRKNRDIDDPDARVAHAFYVEHFDGIEAGAGATNPYRFDKRILLDGQPAEISALQHCLNIIADRGRDHFDTEYQNAPPEAGGIIESGVTPGRIQRQLSGFSRGIVPSGCTVITAGVDVGKYWLHWVVRAWKPDGTTFYTIDYGTKSVIGARRNVTEGLDKLIRIAIKELIENIKANEYMDLGGEIRDVDLTLIDSRYYTNTVKQVCRDLGIRVRPLLGYGKSNGCAKPNFTPVQARSTTRRPLPERAFETREKMTGGNVWVVHIDADHWKRWEHDRWKTAPRSAGCMLLFGTSSNDPKKLSDDERDHEDYADQICGEVEAEKNTNGIIERFWKDKGENHWLDASAYSDVAGSMMGINLFGSEIAEQPKKPTASGGWFAQQKQNRPERRR